MGQLANLKKRYNLGVGSTKFPLYRSSIGLLGCQKTMIAISKWQLIKGWVIQDGGFCVLKNHLYLENY